MTATVSQFLGYSPEGTTTQLPPGDNLPLAATADGGQGGHGQAVFFDATGRIAINDGTVPGLVCAGVIFPAKLTQTSAIAGARRTMVWQGYGSNVPASTVANDAPTIASQCVPVWDAGNGVIGLLSNNAGSNRPLIGLCFGLDDRGNPRYWAGPVASAVARSVLVSSAFIHAWYTITDAAAGTTTAERAIPSSKIHGIINRVEFVGAAVAADNTDYVTITIRKHSLADAYVTGTTVATYDSRAANNGAISAFTPAAFTLSGTAANLEKLETDIYTIEVAKGGAGKQLVGEITVNGKAI